MGYQAPRGTEDVLPNDSHRWLRVEAAFREVSSRYGYQEMRTPTFEETELFTRSAGDTSDIVTKQMYTFMDKGDRSITLKPEGTAGLMRSVIQHSMCPPGTILRLSAITPIFRYERPQKGRLREAHQFDLELVGSAAPMADAEIIEATIAFYREVGLPEVQVLLNSIGRAECRAKYRDAILAHAAAYLQDQDEETRARYQKNPMRLLDSKDEAAKVALQGAPPVTDYLEDESRANFDQLQQLLTDAGVDYVLSPEIVRGLDYYTDTVFEVQSTKLGSQSSLCGGGRYDGLIKELGGKQTPSVGVGMGIERLLIVLEASEIEMSAKRPDAFIISATPAGRTVAAKIARELRAEKLTVLVDPDQRSLKSQLGQADKAKAKLALIVGDEEIAKGAAQIRILDSGEQREVSFEQLVKTVQVLV